MCVILIESRLLNAYVEITDLSITYLEITYLLGAYIENTNYLCRNRRYRFLMWRDPVRPRLQFKIKLAKNTTNRYVF